ncbi:MAG TPA: hypothetical protein VF543_13340 [Pyrinomonadaceae bacterium]
MESPRKPSANRRSWKERAPEEGSMQLERLPARIDPILPRALAQLKTPAEGFTKPFLTTEWGAPTESVSLLQSGGRTGNGSYKQPFQSLARL